MMMNSEEIINFTAHKMTELQLIDSLNKWSSKVRYNDMNTLQMCAGLIPSTKISTTVAESPTKLHKWLHQHGCRTLKNEELMNVKHAVCL